jgi:hypothetical protein
MKTHAPWPNLSSSLVTIALFMAAALPASGAVADAVVSDRGPHHRTWQRVSQRALAEGRTVAQTNSYVELSTGMHFWKDGEWKESKAEFRLFAGGAIADEGPFQLIVTPDIATEGAIDFLTPDAKRFISSPRWLAYYDPDTGQHAMIAAVKSCVGQLVAPNVVVFPDAFDDIHAALRYTYQPGGASGVEQEVILLESGPLNPQDWGLNGANVVLEMWSEFHTHPQPEQTINSVQNGLNDVTLLFGEARIGVGKAFVVGNQETAATVGKTWTVVDQKRFLIEAVRQAQIAPMLATLPQQAQANNPAARVRALAQRKPVAGRSGLLALGTERLQLREKRTQTAAIERAPSRMDRGVTIDYSIMGTTAGFRFRADTTYLVTNSVTLSGTTTIEGGTCIKFANVTNSGSNRLLITGPIDCQTAIYKPAFFSSMDDDTVGEVISGSTGIPGTNRYAGRALDLNAASTTYDLHDLRFRYVDKAIYVSASSAALNLSHTQIGYANIAINNGHPNGIARNVLIHDSLFAIVSASGGTNRLEHATLHRVGTLRNGGTVYLTNSLLISVTNSVIYTGSNVETNLDDTGIFQTVGAGGRYLASQTGYRNSGTTNVNPTLLAELNSGPPIHRCFSPTAFRLI